MTGLPTDEPARAPTSMDADPRPVLNASRDTTRPRLVAVATAAARVLLLPLFAAYRLKLIDYRGCGECLSLVPGPLGRILRRAWYSETLAQCGARLQVHFGTVLRDRRTRIGDDCVFGESNSVGWAHIGNHFVSGPRVSLVAGRHQQRFSRPDVPMRWQRSQTRCVSVGNDVWVGAHAVIAGDVAAHSIVGASALVLDEFSEWSVLAGVPARVIGTRR